VNEIGIDRAVLIRANAVIDVALQAAPAGERRALKRVLIAKVEAAGNECTTLCDMAEWLDIFVEHILIAAYAMRVADHSRTAARGLQMIAAHGSLKSALQAE
jgi:hypothetical protein